MANFAWRARLLAWFALVPILVTASRRRDVPAACNDHSFMDVLPPNTSIEKVDFVESGNTYGEGLRDLNYPIQPTNLPDLCAVTIFVKSSPSSAYRFGLFLPVDWNSRSLVYGNGGFGGGINWLEMGAGVRYGFATISTDTGHNSTTGDVSWALNNPETKMDWGWRSIHGSVEIGKKVVEAYYKKKINYSYYSGCSTGGRQGLKEAQISPDSFDGVLVGSAAWYTSHLNTWVSKVGTYNLPLDGPNHINASVFPAMAKEVVRQCDRLDGVEDGIISAPDACKPDYTVMACNRPGVNQSACLTAAQIETTKKAYGDYRAADGTLLYPGLTPGCENQWSLVLSQNMTSLYGLNYARYFLYDDPQWRWQDYNDSAPEYAARTDPGNATADDYDLKPFRDRGGKMIMYHGLADGLVPVKGSDLYWDRVVTETGGGDAAAVQKFFRYFTVPGMGHCWGTSVDAPWNFGAPFQASYLGYDTWSVPGYRDARHDVLLALMGWVENSTAVDSVVATTWDNSSNASTPVRRQRPLCPYPARAKWDGKGEVNASGSWSCGQVLFFLFVFILLLHDGVKST
ncbi:feruloyl esterase B [Apiospora saccharicola]|uniref:Carboxylic ester hydrolase n=1 Tax=Apiospora saccharicola TaxID=335842 RepID=A0ABR1WKD7_9PEZI